MAEFAYNNIMNASIGHMLFELNYSNHLKTSYNKNVDPHSQSRLIDELITELIELMTVDRKNL